MNAGARGLGARGGAIRPSRRTLTWTSTEVDNLRIGARHGCQASATSSVPIVLVHGLGVSSRYLVPLASRLASRHPVWAPDLPGHGRSDHARDPLDVPALTDVLARWMDAVGLERALLVGQSLGCQVIAELAAREPSRAAGLVLVAPTPDPATRAPLQVALRLLADVPLERVSLLPIVVTDYLRAGPRVVLGEYRAMKEHRLREALDAVRVNAVPCTIVRGGRDPIVSAAWAAEVARLCGAPAPVTLRGCGHAVHHSEPGAIATVVRGMLERT